MRSATEQEITTAIQAGQTVSRVPGSPGVVGSGVRRVGVEVLGAMAAVFGAVWVLL